MKLRGYTSDIPVIYPLAIKQGHRKSANEMAGFNGENNLEIVGLTNFWIPSGTLAVCAQEANWPM